MKRLFCIFLVLCTALLAACAPTVTTPDEVYTTRLEPVDTPTDFVQIELKNGGIIVIELYPDIAPITVENFKKLVGEHFYDGIIFHRVVQGFMVQAGDPEGTGFGGSGEPIIGEFGSNGISNPLRHERGVVSMARQLHDNNTASSQFFIMHETKSNLDGDYAAFGRVIAGMETVDWIAAQPVNGNDKPLDDITMKEVRFVNP
ncbi:MAG: peptidylprolyl isomerase [Ruminococcaceae bacterium]|nr:peptidylprolyl isomerase [Oscillospiraceae bacterium]